MLQTRVDGHGWQMRHTVASNDGTSFDGRYVPAIILLGGFILVLSAADVYGASTTITLDSLPDAVYAGQQVIFTGTLTSGGSPLSGGTIMICEDDPFVPDECLARGVTDRSGRYSIAWTAEVAVIEVDFDIYAEFKSAGGYSSSQTYRQTMSVLKYGGSLTLDDVPARAAYGDVVTFSGVLSLDGHNPEGSVVYIKDEDTLNPDDLLVSAYVDASGRFSTFWVVTDVDPDYTIDIQAVYEANSFYDRMATPIQKLRAYDGPPAPPQPDPSPTTGDGYMKLYHALDFEQSPRIAIVPAPDSYAEVSKHIAPVQEGILQFTTMMEQAYGTGDWSVEFEVVEPGGRFSTKPDIKLDLVTREEDAGCGVDYAGWARIVTTKPVPTVVCSLEGYPDEKIRSTSAHEFIHAIGIGHTFNIQGDMLCSVENDVPTCPDVYNKSTTPSVLNLAAVAAVYGADGFQNPNNNIISKTRFATDGSMTVPFADGTNGINMGAERPNQYDDVYWPEDCYPYEDMNSCLDYYCASYWDIDGFLSYDICLEDPFSYRNPYMDVYWPEDCYPYEDMNSCLDYYCASYWDIDGFLSYDSCLIDPFAYEVENYLDGTISTEQVEVMEHDTPIIVTMIEGSLLPDCQVTDDCFDPNTVTISSGDTVAWVNEDTLIHTVTTLDPHPDGTLDEFVEPGKQFEFTFDTTGEYPYHCIIHPWAVGKVIVESSE